MILGMATIGLTALTIMTLSIVVKKPVTNTKLSVELIILRVSRSFVVIRYGAKKNVLNSYFGLG